MLALAALSLLGLASASPIKRATITCDSTPSYTSTISTSYLISKPDTGVTYYFGIDDSVKVDAQGVQKPILANAAKIDGGE